MSTVRVAETFESIQGESTFAGLPCFFIRLAGCNLNCSYCDTDCARDGGESVDIEALVLQAAASRAAIVEITGGEPLLQAGTAELAKRLAAEAGKPVLLETNGSLDISVIPDAVVAVVDVKTPGSGAGDSFLLRNLECLRPCDELKFVICDRADFEWAADFVRRHSLEQRQPPVAFSPVWEQLEPSLLAAWIQGEKLAVRLQVQLHKVLGVR